MVQVNTVRKIVVMALLLCSSYALSAQRYGKCAYGRSVYNRNRCATSARATADSADMVTAFHVYPNPAQAFCKIKVPTHLYGQRINAALYDGQGGKITTAVFSATASDFTFNFPALAAGQYRLVLTHNSKNETFILQVQN